MGGGGHPDVRHSLSPSPGSATAGQGSPTRGSQNALSFGRRVLGRPAEQMAVALNAAARGRASICSLCRLLCPEQGSSHLSPLPSAPARQTFVLPQNILLIKMMIRSARRARAAPHATRRALAPVLVGSRSSQIHTAAPWAEQPEQRPQKSCQISTPRFARCLQLQSTSHTRNAASILSCYPQILAFQGSPTLGVSHQGPKPQEFQPEAPRMFCSKARPCWKQLCAEANTQRMGARGSSRH